LAPHTTPIFQMLDCRDLKIAKNDRSTFYWSILTQRSLTISWRSCIIFSRLEWKQKVETFFKYGFEFSLNFQPPTQVFREENFGESEGSPETLEYWISPNDLLKKTTRSSIRLK
jgi:hypothetical protein